MPGHVHSAAVFAEHAASAQESERAALHQAGIAAANGIQVFFDCKLFPVRNAVGGLRNDIAHVRTQAAEQCCEAAVLRPHGLRDQVPQVHGEGGTLAGRGDANDDIAVTMHGWRNEIAVLHLVDGIQQHAALLCLAGHRRIQIRLECRRKGNVRTAQVA